MPMHIKKEYLTDLMQAQKTTIQDHISNILFLSTIHLYDDTEQMLIHDDITLPGIVVYPTTPMMPECIIYIIELEEAVKDKGMPVDLATCLLYANDLGCDMIIFDRIQTLATPVLSCKNIGRPGNHTVPFLDLPKNRTKTGKMLTLSTAHISEKTNQMLQTFWDKEPQHTTRNWHLLSDKNGYGWILSIDKPSTQQMLFCWDTEDSLPHDLYICMALATNLGCDFLCLDGDGYTVPYLPIEREVE